MNRRQLREYTFKLLFHANFYDKEELNEQADNYLEECMYPEEGQLLLIEKEKEQLEKRFSMVCWQSLFISIRSWLNGICLYSSTGHIVYKSSV